MLLSWISQSVGCVANHVFLGSLLFFATSMATPTTASTMTTGTPSLKSLNFNERAADYARSRGLKLNYPGTKWCGNGNVAASDSDLGPKRQLDSCCRRHDKCPVHLEGGQTRFGLTNDLAFTISHCKCDANFQRCLERVGGLDARIVKYTFFSLLRPRCLVYEYPRICTKRVNSGLSPKCLQWRYKSTQPKQWSIVDQRSPVVGFIG